MENSPSVRSAKLDVRRTPMENSRRRWVPEDEARWVTGRCHPVRSTVHFCALMENSRYALHEGTRRFPVRSTKCDQAMRRTVVPIITVRSSGCTRSPRRLSTCVVVAYDRHEASRSVLCWLEAGENASLCATRDSVVAHDPA